MRQGVRVIRVPRLVVAVAAVAALAACTAPHAGPDGPAQPGPEHPDGGQAVDPWISDDLELEAAVVTGEFEGLRLAGFTCDITGYFGADSGDGDLPRASVTVGPRGSSLMYRDTEGISDATGPTTSPTSWVDTITVDLPDGYWHLKTESAPEPWSAGVVLSLTRVPVPEGTYGCWAGAVWFDDLHASGTDPTEIVRQFSEIGVSNVEDDPECVDLGFDWAPPGMSCGEFEERIG